MMFLSNKYSVCYYNIINNAKTRKLDEYYEKHHIIPKCMGGTNSKDNLVILTAREHFICHRLLVKMVEGKAKYQMIKASAMMLVKNKNHDRYRVSARLYEKLKKEAALAMSALTKGKAKHTPKSKEILAKKAKSRPSSFKGKSHKESSKKLLAIHRSKPCISPKGERFSSTKEAGKVYNISSVAIRGRIERGMDGWRYERDCHQEIVNKKLQEKKNKPKRVYNSQTEDHIRKRVASRKANGYYKNRQATIAKMSISRKNRS